MCTRPHIYLCTHTHTHTHTHHVCVCIHPPTLTRTHTHTHTHTLRYIGYSKLVVDLDKGFAVGAASSKHVELLGNKVMSLIAYFNLDPNRVLDVMLEYAPCSLFFFSL